MAKKDLIRDELSALYNEGANLAGAFQKNKAKQFQYDYQRWYTKALTAVASLAPDRVAEFRGYYEIDPKRKTFGYGTYVIQDYLKNVIPTAYSDFDSHKQAFVCFFNQLTILHSLTARIDSVLSNIEGELYAELQVAKNRGPAKRYCMADKRSIAVHESEVSSVSQPGSSHHLALTGDLTLHIAGAIVASRLPVAW